MSDSMIAETNLEISPSVENSLEPPPDCEHQEWELGCPRCFFEATNIAKEKVQFVSIEQGHNDTVNGATLFGWWVINVIADMELKLTKLWGTTLDLKQREAAQNVILNLRNLSNAIIRTCSDPSKMDEALITAAEFLQAMNERVKEQKDKPERKPESKIILTDNQ